MLKTQTFKWGFGILLSASIGSLLLLLTPIEQKASQPIASATPAGFTVHIPQRGYMRSKTTISVEAPPSTECELIFISSSGGNSDKEGLGITTADEGGLCIWNFVIEEAEKKYNARLLIYVGGIGETHFMEIRKGY